jgi:hypothetical protein
MELLKEKMHARVEAHRHTGDLLTGGTQRSQGPAGETRPVRRQQASLLIKSSRISTRLIQDIVFFLSVKVADVNSVSHGVASLACLLCLFVCCSLVVPVELDEGQA